MAQVNGHLLTAKERRDRERTFHPADWLCSTEDYSRLVDRGFRIMENMDTEQRTAMVRKAVENKNLDLIKAMMENGLQPYEVFPKDENDDDEWWLLLETIAVCENDEKSADIVTYLLDEGCDTLLYRGTLLLQTINRDLWKIVPVILSHGIAPEEINDPDIQEEIGASLCLEMFKVLEKYGLRFHVEATYSFITGLVGGFRSDTKSRTAEHYRKNQLPMLKALLARGMKIPEYDSVGDAVLPCHELLSWCPERSDDHLSEVMKILLDMGQNMEFEDSCGRTVLEHAVEIHKEKVVKVLAERGADVKTSLLYLSNRSCGLKNFALFRYLIQSGADVNCKYENQEGDIPKILAICLNENMKYAQHLHYLLDNCLPRVNFSKLNNLECEVFQPSILCKLVQVGLSGIPLLSAVLRHALKTQIHRGYDLVRQVCPSTKKLLADYDLLELLKYEISHLGMQIIAEFRQPASLMSWSIYTIRQHLVNISNYFSILPRIRELAAEVPVDLRPMLTLECYMVKDDERCLLGSQNNVEDMYRKNKSILELHKGDTPYNGPCEC